jgi:hypothetical protein
MRFLTAALLLWSSWAAAEEDTKSPPPFFLIDTTDQLCLSGEEFKRCSIDTLFYVVGPPGKLDMLGSAYSRQLCGLHYSSPNKYRHIAYLIPS